MPRRSDAAGTPLLLRRLQHAGYGLARRLVEILVRIHAVYGYVKASSPHMEVYAEDEVEDATGTDSVGPLAPRPHAGLDVGW